MAAALRLAEAADTAGEPRLAAAVGVVLRLVAGVDSMAAAVVVDSTVAAVVHRPREWRHHGRRRRGWKLRGHRCRGWKLRGHLCREWKPREHRCRGWKLRERQCREWKLREHRCRGWNLHEHPCRGWRLRARNLRDLSHRECLRAHVFLDEWNLDELPQDHLLKRETHSARNHQDLAKHQGARWQWALPAFLPHAWVGSILDARRRSTVR